MLEKNLDARVNKVILSHYEEFIDSLDDTIDDLEKKAIARETNGISFLPEIARITHNIRGSCGLFGLRGLGEIAENLEICLESASDFDQSLEEVIIRHIDTMRFVFRKGENLASEELTQILKELSEFCQTGLGKSEPVQKEKPV